MSKKSARQFTLSINLGNDAMRTSAHVAAFLRKLASMIEAYEPGNIVGSGIFDENGNKVGSWSLDLPGEKS